MKPEILNSAICAYCFVKDCWTHVEDMPTSTSSMSTVVLPSGEMGCSWGVDV